MTHLVKDMVVREDGQTSVEYALVVVLIALAVTAFGLALDGLLDTTVDAILDLLS
jgi:Flp pilus assembly pilin Flp